MSLSNICTYPHCGKAIPHGQSRCERHPYDKPRGGKGYGRAWDQTSKAFLQMNPFCVEHMKSGYRGILATEVHHKQRRTHGGLDDWDNLEALCKACHSRKTRGEVWNNETRNEAETDSIENP